jgi:hypothetical protein
MAFGAFVARRELLLHQRLDESLTSEWTWDLLLRLAYQGRRFAVDVDRGPDVIKRDLDHWVPRDEGERRRVLENIRRNVWRTRPRHDFSWTSLGDGELTSSEWFIEPPAGRQMRERLVDLEREHEALRSARTVRWALRLAHAAKRMLGA